MSNADDWIQFIENCGGEFSVDLVPLAGVLDEPQGQQMALMIIHGSKEG